jgi:hypothetical protein
MAERNAGIGDAAAEIGGDRQHIGDPIAAGDVEDPAGPPRPDRGADAAEPRCRVKA